MRLKRIFHTIITIILPVMVLCMTGAKQAAPDKPPWEGMTEPVPCEPYADPVMSVLNSGAVSAYMIDLDPGTYTVAAWASWDLVSVGLVITDSDGNELGRDEGFDNQPMVELVLGTAKQVEIRVMAGKARVEGVPADYSLIVANGSYCYDREPVPTKDILEIWTSVIFEEG